MGKFMTHQCMLNVTRKSQMRTDNNSNGNGKETAEQHRVLLCTKLSKSLAGRFNVCDWPEG